MNYLEVSTPQDRRVQLSGALLRHQNALPERPEFCDGVENCLEGVGPSSTHAT